MYIKVFLLSIFLFFVYFFYQNNQNVLSERISSKESLVRTSNVDSGEYKRPTDITGKIQIIESYNYNEFTIPREYPSKNVYLERKENSGLCYFYGEKSKSIRKIIGKSTYDYYSNVEFRSEISDENSKTWKVVAQISVMKSLSEKMKFLKILSHIIITIISLLPISTEFQNLMISP